MNRYNIFKYLCFEAYRYYTVLFRLIETKKTVYDLSILMYLKISAFRF
jgi:hypothetical protein